MLLRIIGLIGLLMIVLGLKRFYGRIVILGLVIEGKSMVVVGSFILVGVILLINFNAV